MSEPGTYSFVGRIVELFEKRPTPSVFIEPDPPITWPFYAEVAALGKDVEWVRAHMGHSVRITISVEVVE